MGDVDVWRRAGERKLNKGKTGEIVFFFWQPEFFEVST